MDNKQLYTAFSRTTKFEYIHCNNKDLNNKYIDRRTPVLELINSKFNSLYSNGKIYKVTFSDKNVLYWFNMRILKHATKMAFIQ